MGCFMLAEPYFGKLFESLEGLNISVDGRFINHLSISQQIQVYRDRNSLNIN